VSQYASHSLLLSSDASTAYSVRLIAYKTLALYSNAVTNYLVNRSNVTYVQISFESAFSDMLIHVHIQVGNNSMCFFDRKLQKRYTFWLDSYGNVYPEYAPPKDLLIPIDAGITQTLEEFRIYALGYITQKSYTASLVEATTTIGYQQLVYRYLAAQMYSSGMNFRYGIQILGIPIINNIHIEHVHTEYSEALTNLTVTLYNNRMK